jgi:alkanesulfonate monooxygenase SsuD/methylene tetrahydromethanopterin reductase-like flavin-dependent oxidoreductase (luciferase family)
MQFGVFDHVDDSGLPLAEHYDMRLRLAEAVDGMAFHSYHIAEHHGTPLGLAPSPNVYLSAVAQRTKRVRFGPMVYVAALYHPIRLAEEICMLDHMSHGRLQVGIGRGAVGIEQQLFGLDPAIVPKRYAEAREVLLQALASDTVSFAGEHFSFTDYPMVLRPHQRPRPPLWYGIGNPDSAVWAAANDVNVVSLVSAARAALCLDRYRAEWAARGKTPGAEPFLGIARHIVVGETDEEARRIARAGYRKWRASLAHLWSSRGVPFPLEATHPPEWDGFEATGFGIAGTPRAVREYVSAQAGQAHANFMLCQMVFGAMRYEEALHSMQLFSRDVIPALAARGASRELDASCCRG